MSLTEAPSDVVPDVTIKRARRVVPTVGAVVVVILGLVIIGGLVVDDKFHWSTVGKFMLDQQILSGLVVTIELTIICQALGILIGMVIAGMRGSQNKILQGAAWLYIFFFRGTPLMIQLIFWFNLSAILPNLSFPVGGGVVVSVSANALISGFTASVLGFSLHEGAMMAEVIRAGLGGVDKGQREAAIVLGMRRGQVMRLVVAPQVVRLILPVTVNELITLLKGTSLVAFIAGGDLMTRAAEIYSINFEVIPLLTVAALWYLICVSIASVAQYFVEKRFGRGVDVSR